jgi:ribonuclease H-related protein
MKYYAVKSGRTIGVFENWSACQKSINGFSGADYKLFSTREEAEAYINNVDIILQSIQEDIKQGYVVAFCDGSFDKNKNRYSYGVLIIDSSMQEHEICGSAQNVKYISSNNIIGEILGAINALDWAVTYGCEKIKVYHDYEGLSKWISGEWVAKSAAAKMFVTIFNKKYADLLQVEFEKVKGHSNNKYNNKADELAKRALSDNTRVPIKGDSWFSIPYFKPSELQTIMDIISDDYVKLNIEKNEKANSIVYKLELDKYKLTVTLFKGGNKKLLVQGSNTILFQIFITYVNELIGVNADHIIADAYRKSIDSKKIDKGVNSICSIFPTSYPVNIRRLVRQSIINLSYFVECEDYSQYVFPALRALEGHMKYLFGKAGITISKQGFCHFKKDTATNAHYLPRTVISDSVLRNKLEECYNFYYATRHTIFHFGDIIGSTDSTRLIETKNDADVLIKKCLSCICEE